VASVVATGAVVNTDVLPRQRAKLANLQDRDTAAGTGCRNWLGTGSNRPAFDLREITCREIACMELPGLIPTTAIATRHRTNRMQAGA
jgi:hypothetical protein